MKFDPRVCMQLNICLHYHAGLALKFLPIIKAISFQLRNIRTLGAMACSRYEYVKNYEVKDVLLPNVWIIIRVDGKGFHKFSKEHDFEKPNDERGKK
uniref:Probable tRNA(His) guanylyltransferase n=1 Tax=Glossina palpalis gambiensis TaxID=67801 RepID=A0A1B0AUH0_9MUSC